MPAASRNAWPAGLATLGACAIGAVALAVWALTGMMRPPPSQTPEQLADPKQTTADVVVEITGASRNQTLVGLVLVRDSASSGYVRTHTLVRIQGDRATRVLMGSLADLVKGATVDVSGTRVATTPFTVRAARIVVLTGYVKLQ